MNAKRLWTLFLCILTETLVYGQTHDIYAYTFVNSRQIVSNVIDETTLTLEHLTVVLTGYISSLQTSDAISGSFSICPRYCALTDSCVGFIYDLNRCRLLEYNGEETSHDDLAHLRVFLSNGAFLSHILEICPSLFCNGNGACGEVIGGVIQCSCHTGFMGTTCETSCKLTAGGAEYNGKTNTTSAGITCQRWDAQSPHQHNRNNVNSFPETVLAEANNYCRNPDGEAGPWCYTIEESVRWAYCDVPLCN